MTLDIAKLRAKLDSLKDPKKNGNYNKNDKKTWSPDQTKVNTIRLMQYPYGEDPFVELYFHWNIGKGPGILCLSQNFGKTCPVCELGRELNKNGDKETAKKMFAKPRIYAAVVDRADPTMTPKLWGFGKEIYQQLIEALLSEEEATLLDPVTGFDVEVRSEKAEGAEYAKSRLKVKKRESRLAATDAEIQKIIAAVPTVEDVFPAMTEQQINERLTKWMELTENDGSETVKGKAADEGVVDTNADSGSSDDNIKDLDDAFEQALKDK